MSADCCMLAEGVAASLADASRWLRNWALLWMMLGSVDGEEVQCCAPVALMQRVEKH